MSDPAVTTTTDPPTPGWLSKLIVIALGILGALPLSGLLDGHPTAAKVVGLIMIGLAAGGYANHSQAITEVHASATAAATAANGVKS